MLSSEPVAGVCPPVVEYDAAFQAQAAAEVRLLPDAFAIMEMLSDYSGMREQARVCMTRF